MFNFNLFATRIHFLLWATTLLTASILSSLHSVRADDSQPDNSKSADSLIVVISGFDSDPSITQLKGIAARGSGNSGMYQLLADIEKNEPAKNKTSKNKTATQKTVETRFFNWNGTDAGKFTHKDAPGSQGIVQYIRKHMESNKNCRLILIGHSWGGHTMMEVAKELESEPKIEIAQSFAVDPSSLSRGSRPAELPGNIKSCVIYHTHNAFVWGPWKDCDRVTNVDLGDPANGFKSVNGSDYGSAFDISAHNSAEWDEGIHKDIIQRLGVEQSGNDESKEPKSSEPASPKTVVKEGSDNQ